MRASAALPAPYEQCSLCRDAASLRLEDLSQSFLYPIVGLWEGILLLVLELVNIKVWFPIARLEERGGHGGVVQVE